MGHGPAAAMVMRSYAELPLFRGLSRQSVERLSRTIDETAVDAGTVVLPAGSLVRHLYVVVDGVLESIGGRGCVARFCPGSFVALDEFLCGTILDRAISARTDARIITMEARSFGAACCQVELFALRVLTAQAEQRHPRAVGSR